MTSGTNLKKKRKAAKKKKKKQLSSKNKGEDDRKSEEIGDGDGLDEAENEECGSSSVGVDLDSESGDGSGNGNGRGNKAETELEDEDDNDKELSVVRGLDHEESMFVEKPKEDDQGVAENVPIETTEGLNGNGLSEDTILSSQLEHIRVETPTVETQGIKEDDYTESSQNHANVPFAQPMVQQTTWKCCCGLFEVFAGSNRS